MPGDGHESDPPEPRAAGAESSVRASRILARASGVAGAVALASMGLAYVAMQAGLAEPTGVAQGVATGDVGKRIVAQVPAIASPAVNSSRGVDAVVVEPSPEESRPPAIPVEVTPRDSELRSPGTGGDGGVTRVGHVTEGSQEESPPPADGGEGQDDRREWERWRDDVDEDLVRELVEAISGVTGESWENWMPGDR